MSAPPPISVLIPVYNGQRYLRSALHSVLNQSFRDFDCIIVDDGSTDSSLTILKELQAADPRIRIISRPNTGIVGALNDGLAACTGRFIMRMDADDLAAPDRFQKQIDFMHAHPDCVVCGGKILLIDPDDLPLRYECLHTADAEIRQVMRHGGYYFAHPATCIRRDAMLKVGGYRQQYEWVEDLDLWLRLGEIGTFANLPDLVLRYRLHPTSVTHSKACIQRGRRQAAFNEYLANRNLPVLPVDESPPRAASPAGTRANWALMALESRFYSSAIRISAKALRAYPTKFQPWVALTLSLMGPFGRLLVPTILRLRHCRHQSA